jgi:hypothetical protein
MIETGVARKREKFRVIDNPTPIFQGGLNDPIGVTDQDRWCLANPQGCFSPRQGVLVLALFTALVVPYLLPEALVGGATVTGAGITAARNACPGGDCRQLADAFIKAVGGGRLITILPTGERALAVREGIFSTPVAYHAGVLLQNNTVVDVFLSRTFPSIQSWKEFLVQPGATVQIMTGGKVIK